MRKIFAFAPLLTLALTACGNPDTPGGKAADARHESFEEMGDAMKAAGDSLGSGKPDIAVLRASADTIKALAGTLPSWFPAGSGPQDGLKTDALAAIWTKPAEFKTAVDAFTAEAGKFQALAQAGDITAIGAGMKALGGTCKACHDKFKEED